MLFGNFLALVEGVATWIDRRLCCTCNAMVNHRGSLCHQEVLGSTLSTGLFFLLLLMPLAFVFLDCFHNGLERHAVCNGVTANLHTRLANARAEGTRLVFVSVPLIHSESRFCLANWFVCLLCLCFLYCHKGRKTNVIEVKNACNSCL